MSLNFYHNVREKTKKINSEKNNKETAEGFHPLLWINKGNVVLKYIAFVIIPIITFILLLCRPWVKEPDLYLVGYRQHTKTEKVSLHLGNKGDVPAHRVNLVVFVPYIAENLNSKRTYSDLTRIPVPRISRENDSTFSADFFDRVIHPTFLYKQDNFVTDFKLTDATEQQLKETKKSLKYIISSEEGTFKGRIPIADIFKDKN